MKTWIKTNLSKITLALALTGATTGTIGLIMGGMLTHNIGTNVKSYLEPNGEVVLGTTTIWWNKFTSSDKFILYFGNKPIHIGDVVWDGKYPDWYFNQ